MGERGRFGESVHSFMHTQSYIHHMVQHHLLVCIALVQHHLLVYVAMVTSRHILPVSYRWILTLVQILGVLLEACRGRSQAVK